MITMITMITITITITIITVNTGHVQYVRYVQLKGGGRCSLMAGTKPFKSNYISQFLCVLR